MKITIPNGDPYLDLAERQYDWRESVAAPGLVVPSVPGCCPCESRRSTYRSAKEYIWQVLARPDFARRFTQYMSPFEPAKELEELKSI